MNKGQTELFNIFIWIMSISFNFVSKLYGYHYLRFWLGGIQYLKIITKYMPVNISNKFQLDITFYSSTPVNNALQLMSVDFIGHLDLTFVNSSLGFFRCMLLNTFV
jgi:hypothetical protein